MGKQIYWMVLILIAALGLGIMAYYGAQPRPQTRLGLQAYESHEAVARALVSELESEFRQSPLLFLGVEPDVLETVEIAKQVVLQLSQDPNLAYPTQVTDMEVGKESFPVATNLRTRDDFETFVSGTETALLRGQRVVVIVPTVFASQMIPLNLAGNYKLRTGRTSLSLSTTDFPRSREMEKEMRYPCVVEGVDQTGLGPFGCLIATLSRAQYNKKIEGGRAVGILNQIGSKDFLFLYTIQN